MKVLKMLISERKMNNCQKKVTQKTMSMSNVQREFHQKNECGDNEKPAAIYFFVGIKRIKGR